MRLFGSLAGVAACLAASAPAAAQTGSTAESDLRCAAWAAMVAGSNEQPEVQTAFAIAMAWFLGRYETATGTKFEDGLNSEYLLSLQAQAEELGTECMPRMQEMGQRFESWGAHLAAQGASAPTE